MLTYRIEPNSPKSTYFKNKLPDKKQNCPLFRGLMTLSTLCLTFCAQISQN